MAGHYTYLPLERVIFGRPAAEAAAEEAARIGLPATLRAVGVKREQLPAIAEAAMKNLWVRTNPQPIRSAQDVMQLLEAAW